ncbi:MAG: bifunctional methionine sulfoxide reductase B/A protein [Alphaproteobacteria bacterium]|nr:bifunctional methionine sulfoxide reductase B/A protein [Alphaproteobacteria bacterium]
MRRPVASRRQPGPIGARCRRRRGAAGITTDDEAVRAAGRDGRGCLHWGQSQEWRCNVSLGKLFGRSHGAPASAFPVAKTEEEWRRELPPDAFHVLREHGTERAFTSKLNKEQRDGVFHCAGCGQPLFRASAKFDSGTGWPSFWEPIEGAVGTTVDRSFFMTRTEVHCANCGGHLGHVFEDGPAPTGLRYCMNGVSMGFEPATDKAAPAEGAAATAGRAVATFGAGCFWGVEQAFREVDGVLETSVGYAGGKVANPTYEQVCSDRTGHAEVVQVVYDPSKVTYDRLLDLFFELHDPTQKNRQGPDVGTQYRTAVFAHDEAQAAAARAAIARHQPRFRRPIVTEVEPAGPYWPAEDYHQQYLEKRGLASCHVR